MSTINLKRLFAAAIAVFAFIFFMNGLHGNVLMGLYEQTQSTWRNFDEMMNNMPLAMAFQFALALWVTYVFSQLFPEGGVNNGLRYGLYFGVFAGILSASWYLWLPVPSALGLGWFISGIVEGLGCGFLLGAIYRR